MIQVHLNGSKLIPGFDYVAGKNSVCFTGPPAAGTNIVVEDSGGNATRITADGNTFLYQLSVKDYNNTINLLKDALKYYDNPAVADVLERLRVVVELVKQQ
jgi:chaperonin GroEL (HSP60 family)